MRLADAAKLYKKSIKGFIVIIVLYYFVVYAFIPITKNIFQKLSPPKTIANPVYGKLDQLQFVSKEVLGEPLYILNTKNGQLPAQLPAHMPVYKIKPAQFSYLEGKQVISYAKLLGFNESDLLSNLKEEIYKWRKLDTDSILEINTRTKEIILNTELQNKSTSYMKGYLTYSSVLDSAKSLLDKLNKYKDPEYKAGIQKVYFGKYKGNIIVETKQVEEAQIARVDFFRLINKTPIFGPDPEKGLLQVYIGKSGIDFSPLNNPKLDIHYWEIDSTVNSAYPLIPIETAWKAILEGKGIISNATPKSKNPFEEPGPVIIEKILINDIYVAYYETPEYQTYLQPIYVFTGNYTSKGAEGGNITLYFPAISGIYIK